MAQLEFLSWEQRNSRSSLVDYRVLAFSPRGLYPEGTWHVSKGLFHADDEVVFSVVLGESWDTHNLQIPYSEFAWASPQELRLLTALILCEVSDGPPMLLYPVVRFSPILDAQDLDFNAPATLDQIRALVLREAAKPRGIIGNSTLAGALSRSFDLLDAKEFDLHRLSKFWDSLETPNYVLLRGVYALMKSDMLQRHLEFCEEAVHACYIALDSSFTLVTRQLQKEGIAQPTSRDARMWIHRHFDEPLGLPVPDSAEKYFAEFYEQRIMTFHPASRHGDMPYTPGFHDDFVHLRRWLSRVFAYLLTGQHDSAFRRTLGS